MNCLHIISNTKKTGKITTSCGHDIKSKVIKIDTPLPDKCEFCGRKIDYISVGALEGDKITSLEW